LKEERDRKNQQKKSSQLKYTYHILLAEDNTINRKLAVSLITKNGCTITAVNDGAQAVEAYKTDKFDMILMDVQMPQMDGIEATQTIRKLESESGTHIPIIAMTAHAMKGDKERCLEAGMDDYISKPIKPDELYRIINNQHIEKEEPSLDLPDMTASIDMQKALEAVDGDRELMIELINMFLEELPDTMSNLESCVQNANAEDIERKSHTLKGALGNFGADKAVELSFALEKAGRFNELKNASDTLNALQSEMERVRSYFLELLQSSNKE